MQIKLKINKSDQRRFKNTNRRFNYGVEVGIEKGMEIIINKAKQFSGSNQLNIITGSLRDSIEINVKREGSEWVGYIGSDIDYAAIHEFGGVSGRGLKSTIPPRPFLQPAIDSSKDKMGDVLMDEITKAWKGNKLGII